MDVGKFERGLRWEIALTRALIGFTLSACLFLGADVFGVLAEAWRANSPWRVVEQASFMGIVAMLIYGNLVYQFARLGYLQRRRCHRPEAPEALASLRSHAPDLVILVPSYREEVGVLRQALLSAALQDYPKKRVVLLIDDPPETADPESRAALEAARALPGELATLFEKPVRRFAGSLEAFTERERAGDLDLDEETRLVAQLHAEAAAWFESHASDEPEWTHTDRWFVSQVLRGPASSHMDAAFAFEERLALGDPAEPAELRAELEALAGRFHVTLSSFERKRYVNLSHAPNKAMNLNAYIGLLGGCWREVRKQDGAHLERCEAASAELRIPDAEFLITLDADSLLAPRYALRLAHFMARPDNQRVAVVQTPYSAVPDAPGLLERVAGATTDIQYIGHQGFTRYAATYWVGANAMLRKRALDAIGVMESERGHPVPRFIQDRTVIEDTESSVDLIERGWTLHNYPERMAWSATPADFGALLIQRRRWANGGLLILPKLLRYLLRGAWRPRKIGEALLRTHYLVSIAAVNLGLLALLVWPFEEPARQLWLPATALPYYIAYGRDLVQAGYRLGDLLRVYALNLLLLPVNLGGVLQSLRQALTGSKTPFARTPKVAERTVAPLIYLLSLYGLLALMAVDLVLDVALARWLHSSFILLNGGMLLYAVVRFVGFRASLADIDLELGARFRRRAPGSDALV